MKGGEVILKGEHKIIVIIIAALITLTVIGKFVTPFQNVKKELISPIPDESKLEQQNLPGRFTFSKKFRTDFMDSCMATGDVTYSYCECTLDYFGKNYGVEKSEEIAARTTETGEDQPETWEAARACQEKLL